MRTVVTRPVRVATVLLTLLAATLAGCSEDDRPPPTDPSPSAERAPAYDPTAPPAEAVLALIPAQARTVRFTDLAAVKDDLGMVVDATSPEAAQQRFWNRAEEQAPLLTAGVLAEVDSELRTQYGFGRADVQWAAEFAGDGRRGWVIRLRDGVPVKRVAAAVEDGVGPLADAEIDIATRVVSNNAVLPGEPNWAGREGVTDLVGANPVALYLHAGCVAGDPGSPRLDELDAYGVELGGGVVTVRLGEDRSDLFDRLELSEQIPRFRRVMHHGVADPASGRIGYRTDDPVAAADLVMRGGTAPAVCA